MSQLSRAVTARPTTVVGFAMIVAVLGASTGLLRARTWTASAAFVPQNADASRSRIAGLAAQLGVTVPGGDRTQSPDFFAELVRTRNVLLSVASEPMPTSLRADQHAPLAQILDIDEDDPELRMDAVLHELQKNVRTSTGLRTGIVRLDVRLPNRAAARFVCARLVEQANLLMTGTRRQQATAEQRFSEQRLSELGARLQEAENALVAFVRGNRNFITESALAVDRERLSRSVELRRTVYLSVAQAIEQARLDAARDTPVLMVIENAAVPARPDGRGTVVRAALGLIGGAIVGAIWVAWRASRKPKELQQESQP